MISTASSRAGYISLIAAVTVAVLATALLLAARIQADLAPSLRRLREEVRLETAAQSIEARVAFLLTTEPVGARSIEVGADRNLDPQAQAVQQNRRYRSAAGRDINHVGLDGGVYRIDLGALGLGVSYVALQDEAGLFNLNAGDEIALRELLRGSGVSAQSAPRLAASLADFVDSDDLRRAYGAEAREYRRVGLTAPLNDTLQSAWTALEAFGWRDALSAPERERIFSLASGGAPSRTLNINTAPAPVLEAALSLDARMSRVILERRQVTPFASLEEIESLIGARARAESVPLGAAPNGEFRLNIWLEHTGEASRAVYESQLVVTGSVPAPPVYWRRGQVRRGESDGALFDGEHEAETLPQGGAEFPS